MAGIVKLAPELQARIDAVAALSSRSPAEVIADALDHGHSLDWQERFVERVKAGLADADAGRYATEADFERLRTKYRPA
ncbi:transcriptional regulator [uncultured Methylobacterium sp.]|jgi:predicted transcriptional regulator|uniref:CopG family ribbon-helix-helix protein n=1 Tax=uncultured Methylobacterium sp. TaxID=157278 RepID=UPI00262A4866|nr:transcriptional regulator [uncultured Methylobacterium sp.]